MTLKYRRGTFIAKSARDGSALETAGLYVETPLGGSDIVVHRGFYGDRSWRVSHAPSGAAIICDLKTLRSAKAFCEDLYAVVEKHRARRNLGGAHRG